MKMNLRINRNLDLRRGFKKESENKAQNIRLQLGLKPYEPLLTNELARLLGVKIIDPRSINGISSNILNHLMQGGKREWSAVTLVIKESKHIILFNPTHSDFRYESDIMHELAHLLCKHIPGIVPDSGYPFPIVNYDDTYEKEAEWLGGCLKIPRKGLLWALRKGMSIDECSQYFVASKDLVKYRKNVTGVEIQLSHLKKFYS